MSAVSSFIAAPTLVQYAGDDQPAKPRIGLSAPAMFLMGYDTVEIANHLGLPEHVVLRRITAERSRRLKLADPYKKGDA